MTAIVFVLIVLFGLSCSNDAQSTCGYPNKQVILTCSEGYNCCGPTLDPENPRLPKFLCCQGTCTKDNRDCVYNTSTTTTTTTTPPTSTTTTPTNDGLLDQIDVKVAVIVAVIGLVLLNLAICVVTSLTCCCKPVAINIFCP